MGALALSLIDNANRVALRRKRRHKSVRQIAAPFLARVVKANYSDPMSVARTRLRGSARDPPGKLQETGQHEVSKARRQVFLEQPLALYPND